VARKKKQPAHENHERWLVSYADFITLLFAFFVVMFATAQGDKSKAAQVSESVKKALENGKVSSMVSELFGGAPDEIGKGNAQLKGPGGSQRPLEEKKRQIAELLPSLKVLSEELKKEIESGKLQVSMEARGLTVSFKEASLFASGDDTISGEAFKSVAKVATAIDKLPNPVRLEGHTDSVPIHTSRFRSNWELSAARSIALLELLTKKYNVSRDRLSIGGYADTAPIGSNETEDGRAKNRRCDIIILNQTGAMGEPDSHATAAPAQEKPSPVRH
jgi:chemotaxis protein MotB